LCHVPASSIPWTRPHVAIFQHARTTHARSSLYQLSVDTPPLPCNSDSSAGLSDVRHHTVLCAYNPPHHKMATAATTTQLSATFTPARVTTRRGASSGRCARSHPCSHPPDHITDPQNGRHHQRAFPQRSWKTPPKHSIRKRVMVCADCKLSSPIIYLTLPL